MKLFKHRGDIYISKTGYKSSREERILIVLLVFIIIFTIAFLVLLGRQYNSVADFFTDGEITTTEVANMAEDDMLPIIHGKTNYLVMETNDENTELHYLFLVQADSDSLAYKVTSFSPDMVANGKTLLDVYLTGGGAAVQSYLTEYFGFNIDYYAQFKMSDFVEFTNKMGSFIYPISDDIKFDGGNEDDNYTLRLKEGENKIDGKRLSNLLRYYCKDKPNYVNANNVILYALTGMFNAENYEKSEQLFRLFISNSSTNITVRDFENNKDNVMVFCKKNTDITIYSSASVYENNELDHDSMQNIKGYFAY